MEVNKLWKGNDINKYHIISLDKETNEWKFFREIKGNTVFWKDEPSHYGMTKSKAIEVLNIIKYLENEKSETPTETEPENEEESGTTTPTEPSETGETNPIDPSDASTEPSESNTEVPTGTDGETSTGENGSGETPSEGDTEPKTPVEPTEPSEEPQYKIITISSVTYNSEEAVIFDDTDYHKLKTTLTYIDTTYPNTDVHVAVVEDDTGKSIFYFYLDEELTWFLELKTNIDYALVSNVTTLDNIKELL